MKAFYLLSVWIHLLAAIVWIGGMFFFALVFVPLIRREDQKATAAVLTHLAGIRFRLIGWVCIVLLIATGVTNLALSPRWNGVVEGWIWREPFGRLLMEKLGFVALIVAVSVLHDFVIGPRATAAWQASPDSPESVRLRKTASFIARLNALLTLAALFYAVRLVRG